VLLYDHTKHAIDLHTCDATTEAALLKKLDAPRAYAQLEPAATVRVERQFSAAEYRARVKRAKGYIAAGDAFQIVLSQKLSMQVAGSLFDAYRRLRRQNPSPYLYYIRTENLEAAGASPETLVRVEDDMVHVRPIAGTRARGRTPAEDRALEAELLADPKERAEHLMLVDLGRNDVGRVSEAGSVRVEPMMVVERYSHVMHIVSEVSGRLRAEKTALEAFASVFPAGTLSGAPKKRAMEIIAELEGTPRGLYGGAVGYFSSVRSCDFAIAIRTIWKGAAGTACTVQAGAGIVFDSEPEAENQECLKKAASPLLSVGGVLEDA
jgi:anthranilate synthase component 1